MKARKPNIEVSKDVLLILLSLAAVFISLRELNRSDPANVHQRERDGQMRIVCGRAYVAYSHLAIFLGSQEEQATAVQRPAVFSSIQHSTRRLLEALDAGLDLSMVDELSNGDVVALAATQYYLNRAARAHSPESLDAHKVYIASAFFRVLDSCLSYEPNVFSQRVRQETETRLLTEAREAAWNLLIPEDGADSDDRSSSD